MCRSEFGRKTVLFGKLLKEIFRKDEDDYVNDPIAEENNVNNNNVYKNGVCESSVCENIEKVYEEAAAIEDTGIAEKSAKEDINTYIDTAGARIALMMEQNEAFRIEYESVTSYLSDIQIIDSIEGEDRERLLSYAENIVRIEGENKKRSGHDRRISDYHYKIMQQYEGTINHELATMRKKELYQADIRHDMKCLESEQRNLYGQQKEYRNRSGRIRSVSIGMGVLFISLMVLLVVIGLAAGIDMTMPFIILIFAGGLLVLYIFTGMRNTRYKLLLLDKKCNRCINLLNSVKIKYVNNTALLDYMCSKYDISNSVEFEKVWRQYIQVKEDEEALEVNRQELEEQTGLMTELLRAYGLRDTGIWVCQAEALLDKREMVEVRHSLNTRRRKLRRQISFNDERISKDAGFLTELVKKRPQLRNTADMVIKKYSIDEVIMQAQRQ